MLTILKNDKDDDSYMLSYIDFFDFDSNFGMRKNEKNKIQKKKKENLYSIISVK